jgi:hypothetical protein
MTAAPQDPFTDRFTWRRAWICWRVFWLGVRMGAREHRVRPLWLVPRAVARFVRVMRLWRSGVVLDDAIRIERERCLASEATGR